MLWLLCYQDETALTVLTSWKEVILLHSRWNLLHRANILIKELSNLQFVQSS